MSVELEALKNKAYKTAKARFNAADRVKAKQKSLVHFITFLTLVQIAASIALLKASDNSYARLAACLSISFSVFIAIVSNSDSVSKDVLHAHLLHKCGMDLMRLHDKIQADISSSADKIMEYTAEYSDIINDCSLNHATVDFQKAERQLGTKTHKWCGIRTFFKTYSIVLGYLICTLILCAISYFLIGI
jgi:hypothetical protein